MLPKLTIQMSPDELYDEIDLLIALRALNVALTGVSIGLGECEVRDATGESREIPDALQGMSDTLLDFQRSIIAGKFAVVRKE